MRAVTRSDASYASVFVAVQDAEKLNKPKLREHQPKGIIVIAEFLIMKVRPLVMRENRLEK